MKLIHAIALSAFIISGASACGSKGRLKNPSQIKAQEEKDARRAAKEANRAAKREAAEKERLRKFPQSAAPDIAPPLEGGLENNPPTPAPAGSE